MITSADGLVWYRVPDDERIFGGPGWQEMYGVAAVGRGLVAVGHDHSGEDWNAAVWTLADGLMWMRTPDSFGTSGAGTTRGCVRWQLGGPGVIAAGYADGQGVYEEKNAAVWVGSLAG